jgi:hypothetical protein
MHALYTVTHATLLPYTLPRTLAYTYTHPYALPYTIEQEHPLSSYTKMALTVATGGRVFCTNANKVGGNSQKGLLKIPNDSNEQIKMRISIRAQQSATAESVDICGKPCEQRSADCSKTWCTTCPGISPPTGFQSSTNISALCPDVCGPTMSSYDGDDKADILGESAKDAVLTEATEAAR